MHVDLGLLKIWSYTLDGDPPPANCTTDTDKHSISVLRQIKEDHNLLISLLNYDCVCRAAPGKVTRSLILYLKIIWNDLMPKPLELEIHTNPMAYKKKTISRHCTVKQKYNGSPLSSPHISIFNDVQNILLSAISAFNLELGHGSYDTGSDEGNPLVLKQLKKK